jgi:hypothetical protein
MLPPQPEHLVPCSALPAADRRATAGVSGREAPREKAVLSAVQTKPPAASSFGLRARREGKEEKSWNRRPGALIVAVQHDRGSGRSCCRGPMPRRHRPPGSGRKAESPSEPRGSLFSQTFSLPDRLGRAFVPGSFFMLDALPAARSCAAGRASHQGTEAAPPPAIRTGPPVSVTDGLGCVVIDTAPCSGAAYLAAGARARTRKPREWSCRRSRACPRHR